MFLFPFLRAFFANSSALGVAHHNSCFPRGVSCEKRSAFFCECGHLALISLAQTLSEISKYGDTLSACLPFSQSFFGEVGRPFQANCLICKLNFQPVSACDSAPMPQLLGLRGVSYEAPGDVLEKAPMDHARKHKHIAIETFIPQNMARGLYFSSAHFATKLMAGHAVALGGHGILK